MSLPFLIVIVGDFSVNPSKSWTFTEIPNRVDVGKLK